METLSSLRTVKMVQAKISVAAAIERFRGKITSG